MVAKVGQRPIGSHSIPISARVPTEITRSGQRASRIIFTRSFHKKSTAQPILRKSALRRAVLVQRSSVRLSSANSMVKELHW